MTPRYLDRINGERGTARFTIPAALARLVPKDAVFEVELTDDGILLRFKGLMPRGTTGDEAALADAPAWTKP